MTVSDRFVGRLGVAASLVGIVVGTGIAVAPQAVSRALPGTAGLVLWLVGGAVSAVGALVYAECGARLPVHGGFYAYYQAVFGAPAARFAAYAALLLAFPASIASIAGVVAKSHGTGWALVALAAVAAVNARPPQWGLWVLHSLTWSKVAFFAVLIGVGFASVGSPSAAAVAEPSLDPEVWLAALMVVLWTFDGWANLSLFAAYVEAPKKALLQGTVIGMAVVMALYLGVHAAAVSALSPAQMEAAQVPLAAWVEQSVGPVAHGLVRGLILLGAVGSLHGLFWVVLRLMKALAEDRALPKAWARSDAGSAALLAASLVYFTQASWMGALTYFSLCAWGFRGATAVSLILLRRRQAAAGALWPALRFTPWALLACSAIVSALLVVAYTWTAALSLAVFGVAFLLAVQRGRIARQSTL